VRQRIAVIKTVVKSNKKSTRATAVTEKCCTLDRMDSVYRRSTLFNVWSYSAEVVEIRLLWTQI